MAVTQQEIENRLRDAADELRVAIVILGNVPARVRSGLRRHRPMPGRPSVQGPWWGASS